MTTRIKLLGLLLTITTVFQGWAQQTSETVTINGVTRNYILYKPANFQASENMPVVFVLHGLGSDNVTMTATGFSQIADTARFIVIYPQGVNNTFGSASWNNGTALSSNVDDVGFFITLIEDMVANQGANRNRVYFTGFSMGSIMSHHMACLMNDKIAAIGAMAGTMATVDIDNCVPTYKTPVIHLHGTDDGTVPYDENPLPGLSLVPETMEFWRNVHGCTTNTDSSRIADTASDNITIDRFVYTDCIEEDVLELWRFNGADHIYLFEPFNDITEAKEIWKFFAQWTHPNASSSANLTEEGKSSSFKLSPNPSKGAITIESDYEGKFNIYNVAGQKVETIRLKKGTNQMKLKLPQGIYLLQLPQSSVKIEIQK